jgi:hypothetical protein
METRLANLSLPEHVDELQGSDGRTPVILRRFLSYCAGKVLRYGITLVVILSMNFVMPKIMPGDPKINLLEDVTGRLPDDKDAMLAVIDPYLALPAEE